MTTSSPGGAFAMYNYYRETWLIDRLASTAQKAFGHKPCVDEVGDDLQQAVITVGLTDAGPDAARAEWAGATADHAAAGHRQPAVPLPVHGPASRRSTSSRSG